jgi:hypothetical protein
MTLNKIIINIDYFANIFYTMPRIKLVRTNIKLTSSKFILNMVLSKQISQIEKEKDKDSLYKLLQ